MINLIWVFLCGSAIIYSLLTGNAKFINKEILNAVYSGLNLCLDMAPIIILWMGIMSLANSSGLLEKFGKLIRPFLCKLFPSLNKNSKSLDYIASNIACNMLGMGSAATPFGLKAMASMQEENKNKDTASTAMITFLVLNTAGVTLIPTTTIALRMSHGSLNPTCIILPSIIATTVSSICGLTLDYIIRKKNKE
ncbi:MAG: nucleoside recognition domain-containing protein [Bacilli bacterium]|nr:nucleoside recognition domain-containing protein [Bacilli bacterium]